MEIALATVIAQPEGKCRKNLLRRFGFAECDSVSRIGVDNFLVLAKCSELRDQIAYGIHRDRITVEDQLIVAADEIAVTDWPLISSRETCHQFVADCRLVQAERRRA